MGKVVMKTEERLPLREMSARAECGISPPPSSPAEAESDHVTSSCGGDDDRIYDGIVQDKNSDNDSRSIESSVDTMRVGCTWWGLVLASLASASPARLQETKQAPLNVQGTPRPLVIWHGLGDTALSKGIQGFIEDIQSTRPGIFVYSVQIPEGGSEDDERKAGFVPPLLLSMTSGRS